MSRQLSWARLPVDYGRCERLPPSQVGLHKKWSGNKLLSKEHWKKLKTARIIKLFGKILELEKSQASVSLDGYLENSRY